MGTDQSPRCVDACELLSVQEVATLLGCSPRYIYRMVDMELIPRPLHLVRWQRSRIMAWFAQGCPVETANQGRCK